MFKLVNLVALVSEFVGYEVERVEVWEKVLFVVGKDCGPRFVSKEGFKKYWEGRKFGTWTVCVRSKGFDIKGLVKKIVKERGWRVGKDLVQTINNRTKVMGDLVQYQDMVLLIDKLTLPDYQMVEINSVWFTEKRKVVVFVI
jgi:hypothetical protein